MSLHPVLALSPILGLLVLTCLSTYVRHKPLILDIQPGANQSSCSKACLNSTYDRCFFASKSSTCFLLNCPNSTSCSNITEEELLMDQEAGESSKAPEGTVSNNTEHLTQVKATDNILAEEKGTSTLARLEGITISPQNENKAGTAPPSETFPPLIPSVSSESSVHPSIESQAKTVNASKKPEGNFTYSTLPTAETQSPVKSDSANTLTSDKTAANSLGSTLTASTTPTLVPTTTLETRSLTTQATKTLGLPSNRSETAGKTTSAAMVTNGTTSEPPATNSTTSPTTDTSTSSATEKKPSSTTPDVQSPDATSRATSLRLATPQPSTKDTGKSSIAITGRPLTRELVDRSALLAVLLFGTLFFLVTVVLFLSQAYESYRRKDYTQVDYLINGMYSDSGV